MNELINLIKTYTPLSKETIEGLKERLMCEVFQRNHFILQPGEYCNKLFFIKSGMIRKYFLHNGKEITKWIHCEGEIATSLGSFFKQLPSNEYLQATEETEVITISYSVREELTNKYPQIERFGRLIMEDQVTLLDEINKRFNLMSARERYNMMLALAPGIFLRAKLGHISSLLGISQETLSRIRSLK